MLRHWQLLQSSDKFQFGLELLGAIKVRQASSLSRPHDICNKGNFGGMLLAKFNSTTGRTKSSWDMSCPGTFPSQGLRAAAKYGTIRSVWGRGVEFWLKLRQRQGKKLSAWSVLWMRDHSRKRQGKEPADHLSSLRGRPSSPAVARRAVTSCNHVRTLRLLAKSRVAGFNLLMAFRLHSACLRSRSLSTIGGDSSNATMRQGALLATMSLVPACPSTSDDIACGGSQSWFWPRSGLRLQREEHRKPRHVCLEQDLGVYYCRILGNTWLGS